MGVAMAPRRSAEASGYRGACSSPAVRCPPTGDVIAGIDLVDVNGVERPGVETSYGLVLPDGDAFAWVCHEAVLADGALRSPLRPPPRRRLARLGPRPRAGPRRSHPLPLGRRLRLARRRPRRPR
ncbi:MAG: hypothetical protein R3F59_09905 [Myxococcota bacterium]